MELTCRVSRLPLARALPRPAAVPRRLCSAGSRLRIRCSSSEKPGLSSADGGVVKFPAWMRTKYDEEIFSLMLPSLGAIGVDPLMSLADTAFVGRLGVRSLAALGPNTSIYHFAFDVFKFLSGASTTLVGQAFAKGDSREVGECVLQMSLLSLLLGGAMCGLLLHFKWHLIGLMGAGAPSTSLAQEAAAYFVPRALATPIVPLGLVAVGAFRGIGDVRAPLYVALFATVLNIVLDPLLMFSCNMGIAGAAWGTGIAELVETSLFLAILWQVRSQLGVTDKVLRDGSWKKFFNLAGLGPVLKASSTLMLRSAVNLTCWAYATAQATRLGVVTAAAHQIALEMFMLFSMVMTAHRLGGGDASELRPLVSRLFQMAAIGGGVCGLVLAACSGVLPSIFCSGVEVQNITQVSLVMVAVLQPLVACTDVAEGVLAGAGDFNYLLWSMMASVPVMTVLLYLVPSKGLGLTGIWFSIACMFLARLAACWWRIAAKGFSAGTLKTLDK
eukprot:jgi/Mesvir1/23976/Mv10738-RA.2